MPDSQTAHIQAYHKGVLSTELAALTGASNGHVLAITGHTTAGDGGGGLARWDAASTATDDGGTVWGAAVAGRWKRVFDGDVDVRWFGADSSGALSSTTAIQAAIDTGKGVIFPSGTYLCSGLLQSTASQRLYCPNGVALLSKNANGQILTSTGNDVCLNRIRFYGHYPAYTGNNASFSGAQAQLIDCASDTAAGRAVLMTGQACSILGTCGNYTTSDSTSSGWDIEFNGSTGQLLYGKIDGIRTSQSTGGILMNATGAHTISNSQFGKFKCDDSAGSGGTPRVTNCRITGAVTINESNGVFAGNQFGAVSITFGAGTGSNSIDYSNNLSAVTSIINNGNVNNLVLRETSAGSTYKLKVGADSSLAVQTWDPDGNLSLPGNTTIPSEKSFACRNVANDANALSAGTNASDNAFIAHGSGSFMAISSTGTLQLIGTSGIDISSALSTHLIHKTNLAVTASTTQTQAAGIALALTGDIVRVATCANANDAIALPTAVAGRDVTVINDGAQTVQIFPYTSDNFAGSAVNVSTTLTAGSRRRFVAIDAITWVVV